MNAGFLFEDVDRLKAAFANAGAKKVAFGIVVLGLVIASLVLFSNKPQTVKVELQVVDSGQNALEGAKIEWIGHANVWTTGADGKANFEIPAGASLRVRAGKAGFETTEKSWSVTDFPASSLSETIVLNSLSEAETRIISFAGMDNKKISKKQVSGRFVCANSGVFATPTVFDSQSDKPISVSVPSDCGALEVVIVGPSEFAGFSYPVTSKTAVVRLSTQANRLFEFEGSIEVTLTGSDLDKIAKTGFWISVFSDNELLQTVPSSNAKARLAGLLPGNYDVIVNDPAAEFAAASLVGIRLDAKENKKVSIPVRQTQKKISVLVRDSATGNPVGKSRVGLTDSKANAVLAVGQTNADGVALFGFESVPENSVWMDVFADGFEFMRNGLDFSLETQEVLLSKSSDSAPELEVLVLDESQERVPNSRVILVNSEKNSVLLGIPAQFSDSLGIAVFTGVSGSVIAVAKKGLLTGRSEPVTAGSASQPAKIVLKAPIVKAAVNVRDGQENKISQAAVSVESLDQKQLTAGETDTEGRVILEVSANQTILVRASKDGFGSASSSQLFVIEDFETQLALDSQSTQNDLPAVSLDEILDNAGEPATKLFADAEYEAHFTVSIPSDSREAGFFVSFSNPPVTTQGLATIRFVESGTGDVFLGERLDPMAGQPSDLSESNRKFTAGNWGRVLWRNPLANRQAIAVHLRTSESVSASESLEIHFRSWAVSSDGYRTDPVDPDVTGPEPAKDLLYADTLSESFGFQNVLDQCGTTICLSDFLVETPDGTQTAPPFVIPGDSLIRLEFKATNALPSKQSGLKLAVANEVNGVISDQLAVEKIEFNGIEVSLDQESFGTQADLELDASEAGTISVFVHSAKSYPSDLHIRLLDDSGDLRAEQFVPFEVRNDSALKLVSSVSQIVPFSPTPLDVQVLSKATGEPVEEALVRVEALSPTADELDFEQLTDSDGIAVFDLPEFSPDTQVTITGQKSGFDSDEITIGVGPALQFSPEEILFELSSQAMPSRIVPLSISNLTQSDATIFQAELAGSFLGVLDSNSLNESQWDLIGTAVPANDRQSVSLSATLDPEISSEAEFSIAGNEVFEFGFGSESYLYSIPVEVSVGKTATGPGSDNCLQIDKTNWSGSTTENRSDFAFTLENACETDFNQLVATVVWSSQIVGNVELRMDSGSTVVLNADRWSPVVGDFPVRKYSGLLTFTPNSGELGASAGFIVYLAGEKASDHSRIIASPITSQILLANLENCLVYSPHPKTGIVVPFNGETEFTLDGSNCGSRGLEIELCSNDPGCSGGTSEGTISVSPLSFSLDSSNPKQVVKVRGVDLPGRFDIGISGRVQSGEFSQIASMKTLVQTNPDAFLDLGKFEFFLKGAGTADAATVFNRNLSTRVNVQATAADWAALTPDDLSGYDAAGIGLTPEGINDLNDAMAAGHLLAAQQARETAQKIDEARNLSDQALNSQNNAADKTKQASDGIGQTLGLADQGTNVAQALMADCQPLAACAAKALACTTCKADAARVCASAQSILGGMGSAVSAPLTSAQQAIQNAVGKIGQAHPIGHIPLAPKQAESRKKAFLADIENDFVWHPTQIFLLALDAVSASSDALTQLDDARSAAAVPDFAGITSGADSGSATAEESCTSNLQASQFDQQGQQETQNGGQNLTTAGTGVGSNAAQAGILESQIASSQLEFWCPGEVTTLRTRFYAFKGIQTGLQAGEASVPGSQSKNDDAKQSQQAGQLASTTASTAACLASERLKAFADAAEKLSQDVGGDRNETTQNLATQLAAGVSTGYLEGIYGPGDLVINELTGYVINLKNDALGVKLETDKVTGAFETDSAAVMGEYKRQTAGIAFHNESLGEESVFSVVTLNTNLHEYADPAVAFGESDWGPYKLESIGTTTDYSQKFHLKFSGGEEAAPIEATQDNSVECQSGALLGRTGPGALPRIKLKWNWTDITMDSCDAKNPDYIYCDATQFSIMVNQRLHALQEFLEKNPVLNCPVNSYEQNLDSEMAGLALLGGSSGFSTATHLTGCWLPKTTALLDNRAGLEYFVEETPAISWTGSVPDVEALHDLLFFDAFLIQDGYGADFRNDFREYFTHIAFLDTPQYFSDSQVSKRLNKFWENDLLVFRQKFGSQEILPTSGRYEVGLNVDFDGEEWGLFSASGDPAARIQIDLLSAEQSSLESPFYFLPFDGEVGLSGDSFDRQEYGAGYAVANSRIFGISRTEAILTRPSSGTDSLVHLSIEQANQFGEVNAIPSRRGYLLDAAFTNNADSGWVFSPTLATPVLLKVTSPKTEKPFSAFYSLRIGDAAFTFGDSALFWSGAGQCTDFDGAPVNEKWILEPDRKGRVSDHLDRYADVYALDWPNAERDATVFFKSVVFTPIGFSPDLVSESDNAVFWTPEDPEGKSVHLQGISTMLFNRSGQTASDKVTSLDDLFSLVQSGSACVTNTGVRSSFWWNPDALYKQAGELQPSLGNREEELTIQALCK